MTSGLEQLSPGDLFAGRYRVVRPIGRGGFGALYEVVDERTSGRRALKVLLPGALTSSDLRERFTREARLTGAIESDHVVRVLDASASEELPYLVMELLAGEDLEETLRREGSLTPARALALLGQAARGLDRTHATGVVHRDLKPENLYVTRREDGSTCLKLVDFGLAKLSAPKGAPTTRVIGTPLYMAPEQVRGDGDVSPRADLYAFAQVAYTLLVGEPYFAEEVDNGVLALMVHICRGTSDRPVARAERRRGVILPAAFDVWFARATALEPSERFGSALEQIAALRAAYEPAPAASLATDPTLDARVALAHGVTAVGASPRALSADLRAPLAPSPHAVSLAASRADFAASAAAPTPLVGPAPTAVAPVTLREPTLRSPVLAEPPRAPQRASRLGLPWWGSVALAAAALAAAVAIGWSLWRTAPSSTRSSSAEAKPRKQRPSAPTASGARPPPSVAPSVVFTSHPLGCTPPTCASFEPKDRSRVTSSELLALFERAAHAMDADAKLFGLSISMHLSAAGVDTRPIDSTPQLVFTSPRGTLVVSHLQGKLLTVRGEEPPPSAVTPFGACTLERAVAIAEREGVVFGRDLVSQSAFYGRFDGEQGLWTVQSEGHSLMILAPACTLHLHARPKVLP